MRIAFDAESLTRERSAAANYLAHLVEGLVAADGDIQIVLLSPEKICVEYDRFIRHPRVRRVCADLPREQRRQWVAKYLPRLVKEHGVELLHQPGGLDMPPVRFSCPVIVTAHDMVPLVLNAFKFWRKALRYRLRSFIWAHRAAKVMTGAEASRKDIIRLCHVRPDKVLAVPYGASKVHEDEIPAAEAESILRKYRLAGRRYVINPGGLSHKRRNLDLVLDGFARFHRDALEDVALVFTGAIANSQGAFDRAQRKIGILGLRERVITTGFVAEKTLQVILDNAQAAVVTSFYEGFPQSMAEAFASGTAVIATDRGGVPEIAGEAAVIIDPYDPPALAQALRRLLCNDVERELYVEKGYERARELLWQRMAQETLGVYRSVLK